MLGFIGAGKVGTSLARFFYEYYVHKGLTSLALSSICSKHLSSANDTISSISKLSCNLPDIALPKVADTLSSLVEKSDIIFVTVTDSVISDIDDKLSKLGRDALKDKVLVHCSGVLCAEAGFKKCSKLTDTVSLHPMLAFNSKETPLDSIQKAFFTLEGSDTGVEKLKELLGKTKLAHTVLSKSDTPDKLKAKYHLASVLVSNCVVGLFSMGQNLLCECGFTEDEALKALTPLFISNANNIVKSGVNDALTGPVIRDDAITVQKHMSTLNDEDKELYRLLSKKLYEISKNKNPDMDYDNIKKLLLTEDKK